MIVICRLEGARTVGIAAQHVACVDQTESGRCEVSMINGKRFVVYEKYEDLIQKFNNATR